MHQDRVHLLHERGLRSRHGEEDVRQLARFGPVIQNIVVQDLRVRYQRSVLGFFWTLLNPILMMGTLALIFTQLIPQDPFRFAIYLFAGMVPWGFLSGSLNECAFCIIAKTGSSSHVSRGGRGCGNWVSHISRPCACGSACSSRSR